MPQPLGQPIFPRKLRAIYQNERKSDRRDAQMLARIGRLDPALLYPVRHATEEAQADLLRIKLRDSLVRARVALINSVRLASRVWATACPSLPVNASTRWLRKGCPR